MSKHSPDLFNSFDEREKLLVMLNEKNLQIKYFRRKVEKLVDELRKLKGIQK